MKGRTEGRPVDRRRQGLLARFAAFPVCRPSTLRSTATAEDGPSTVAFLLMVMLALPSISSGHHILGIPHYAYDEQYPQTPILTYAVQAGRYDLKMTGYPGHPIPQERTSLHVYLTDRETGALYDGVVTLTVCLDRLIGEDPVVYGPMDADLEERVYKFYPEFPEAANYTVRIAFMGKDEPWVVDLPMVAGEPGSPWSVAASVLGSFVLFAVVIRAVRIKMKRRQLIEARRPASFSVVQV